jgi:FkbM family methyltransferase
MDIPPRLLIVTRQAANWYDRFDLTEGPCVDALQMVHKGDTVFDCGSHHGVNSLLYARMVGPSGRVVAFGTYPMNNKIAKLNALLNNCVNIDFVDSALGSTAGLTTASVGEQCIVLKNFDANDVIPLKLATLDKYAELRPNFIKNRY